MRTSKPFKHGLPPRFQKVADQIVLGKSDKEISVLVNLSVSTVRSYVRTMYRRMGVHGRVEFCNKLRDINNQKIPGSTSTAGEEVSCS